MKIYVEIEKNSRGWYGFKRFSTEAKFDPFLFPSVLDKCLDLLGADAIRRVNVYKDVRGNAVYVGYVTPRGKINRPAEDGSDDWMTLTILQRRDAIDNPLKLK